MTSKGLFQHEEDVIEKIKEIINKKNLPKKEIKNEFNYLFDEYVKLVNQMKKIFTISDINQKGLRQIQEELKKEINERKNTEKKLENKVEKLNAMKFKLEKMNNKLEKLSTRDNLTGLPNRRKYREISKKEVNRAKRNKSPISMMMCDIDDFKKYNDTYGHLVGDDCLKKVAGVLKENTKRTTDFVARYGGEEFVIILPNTEKKGAKKIAEKIKKDIWNLSITNKKSKIDKYLTLSIGIVTAICDKDISAKDILEKADKMLYKAKREGKNDIATGIYINI